MEGRERRDEKQRGALIDLRYFFFPSRTNEEVITFVLDITARKQAELSALQAAEAKSYFVANISHGE